MVKVLYDTLAGVQGGTTVRSLDDGKAEAQVNTLADSLAMVAAETLAVTPVDVEPRH